LEDGVSGLGAGAWLTGIESIALDVEQREMIDAREFPVGSQPGWELEQPDSDEQESSLPLKSVADR
jgi:hypothetical protein